MYISFQVSVRFVDDGYHFPLFNASYKYEVEKRPESDEAIKMFVKEMTMRRLKDDNVLKEEDLDDPSFLSITIYGITISETCPFELRINGPENKR